MCTPFITILVLPLSYFKCDGLCNVVGMSTLRAAGFLYLDFLDLQPHQQLLCCCTIGSPAQTLPERCRNFRDLKRNFCARSRSNDTGFLQKATRSLEFGSFYPWSPVPPCLRCNFTVEYEKRVLNERARRDNRKQKQSLQFTCSRLAGDR